MCSKATWPRSQEAQSWWQTVPRPSSAPPVYHFSCILCAALRHGRSPAHLTGTIESRIRFAGTSSTASGPSVHLAVPENCCGLTLILAVFDRCGKGALAFSATGSARASFPPAGGRLCGRLIAAPTALFPPYRILRQHLLSFEVLSFERTRGSVSFPADGTVAASKPSPRTGKVSSAVSRPKGLASRRKADDG